MAASNSAATGLLHVGFEQPEADDIRALLAQLPSGLYLTESSRHAVPADCQVTSWPAGRCVGREFRSQSVYRAVGWWLGTDMGEDPQPGPRLESPSSDHAARELSAQLSNSPPAIWLGPLAESCPEAVALLEQEGVRTDEDFQNIRLRLPERVRRRIDAVRFVALTGGTHKSDPFAFARLLPDWVFAALLRELALPVRCLNVFRSARLATVEQALMPGPAGILGLKNFGATTLRIFAERLYAFAANPEPAPADPTIELDAWGEPLPLRARSPWFPRSDWPSTSRAAAASLEFPTLRLALEAGLADIAERQARVIRLHLGMAGEPKTLEEIGAELGVTRERARQIRQSGWGHIRYRWRWPHELGHRIEYLQRGRREPCWLDTMADLDDWFDGFQPRLPVLGRIISQLVGDEQHVWAVNDRMIVTKCEAKRWPEMVDAARSALERELAHGVTQPGARWHIASVAIEAGSPELADMLYDTLAPELHFAEHPGGDDLLVSVGRGMAHTVLTVLTESDRPLHITEIIERLREKGHASRDTPTTRNSLRKALHDAGAVLVGTSVYGLESHLPLTPALSDDALHELEGIVEEGDPGRQWHGAELADELSALHPELADELDRFTINAILRHSRKLSYLGYSVWVGTHEAPGMPDRLNLAALCEKALEEAGRPLSNSELRSAMRKVRGVNPNFLIRVSPRVVRLDQGMWGLADRDLGFSPEHRQAALDALHDALERRQKGLHRSELFDALAEVDFAREPALDEGKLLGIAQSDARFRVFRGQIVGLAGWEDARRRHIGQAFSELRESWKTPMTSRALHRAVCKLMERRISRDYVLNNAVRCGFVRDADSGRWELAVEVDESDEAADVEDGRDGRTTRYIHASAG